MSIGRNDRCLCGSGKKYKRCCINRDDDPQIVWKENYDKLDINIDKKEELKQVLFYSYDFMIKNNWQGACHALSAIQYIVLNELELNPKLCMGVVGNSLYEFDHSWIELNNQVYDITIANCLEGVKFSEPIIASVNINTMQKTNVEHGRNRRLDFPASAIKELTLTDYLDGFTNQPKSEIPYFLANGLWNLIIKFGKEVNLELNETYLKEKYSTVKTNVV
ncbi:YecA family protein [Clostridium baratii]|uniref:YecA family protein n=1 Tax=Clostridium baratii TaxID=1561 RepID=UPI001C20FD9B|nr:SEC-C metal-binding domain-containing protein [Clostridium baratii]